MIGKKIGEISKLEAELSKSLTEFETKIKTEFNLNGVEKMELFVKIVAIKKKIRTLGKEYGIPPLPPKDR